MIARGIHFTMLQHVIAAIWLIHAGQTQSATDPKPIPSWTVNAWYHNIYGIGICLVGDFEKTRPTPKQLRALDSLVATLAARYDIPPREEPLDRRPAPPRCATSPIDVNGQKSSSRAYKGAPLLRYPLLSRAEANEFGVESAVAKTRGEVAMTYHAPLQLLDYYPSAASSALRGMRRVSNDAYVATMEAHLEMWGAPIDRIRQRAEKASGEGRIGYLAQADAASALRAEIAQQLHELQTANEERFTALRSGIAEAWKRFTSEVCKK